MKIENFGKVESLVLYRRRLIDKIKKTEDDVFNISIQSEYMDEIKPYIKDSILKYLKQELEGVNAQLQSLGVEL